MASLVPNLGVNNGEEMCLKVSPRTSLWKLVHSGSDPKMWVNSSRTVELPFILRVTEGVPKLKSCDTTLGICGLARGGCRINQVLKRDHL